MGHVGNAVGANYPCQWWGLVHQSFNPKPLQAEVSLECLVFFGCGQVVVFEARRSPLFFKGGRVDTEHPLWLVRPPGP